MESYTPSPARSPPRAARNSSHSSANDIEDEFDRLIGSLGRLEKPSRDSDDWLASAANDWIDQVEAAGEEDYLDEYDREPSPLSSEDWLDDYDEPLPPLDGILVARALNAQVEIRITAPLVLLLHGRAHMSFQASCCSNLNHT